jgi:choline-sulfatase
LPPLPENFRIDDFQSRPIPVQYICCSHNRQAQAAGWNETNYRHYLAAYHHYLSRVDAEIGLVLDALESRDDADRTLIVFMADHGDGMAAYGHVTKQVSLYDQTTRVPLVFAGPGVEGQGRVVEDGCLVSLLDLLPTLCDVAGIDAPDDLWGRSLRPQLTDAAGAESPHDIVASQWQTEWGFTVSPGRMIRSRRYKYMRYLEGDGEELYDLAADPGETRTLVGDPAHAAALAEHREKLRALLETTGDPFFDLPWQADARWRHHAPGYQNHTGPSAPVANKG